jgi:hypothetical protein
MNISRLLRFFDSLATPGAFAGFALLGALALQAPANAADDPLQTARARWEQSTHGEMLKRILPPGIDAHQLPEPKSRGAQLTVSYCVQCHNLAPPAMHHAEKWPQIVARMTPRMQGRGNMGTLMKDLMAGVAAPTEEETRVIVAYLQKHGQKHIEQAALPEANKTLAWAHYTQACSQCHIAPDPRRYSRSEWPRVVARMEKNMEWMNRVVGSKANPREPQYTREEIVAYLQRYARR